MSGKDAGNQETRKPGNQETKASGKAPSPGCKQGQKGWKQTGRMLVCAGGLLGLAACGRQTAGGKTKEAASPTPAGERQTAGTAQDGGAGGKAGLPDFAVQPVRTEEGTALWYDVPDDSLAARRAWPEEMTAASDVLPQNTYVRVTPLGKEGGEKGGDAKPVVVRITDNGVHRKGVLIDVDRDAARALGMVKAGEVKVRVEVLALQNASADKPVEKKDEPSMAKKASEITATPAVSAQAERDAAKAKAGGATP